MSQDLAFSFAVAASVGVATGAIGMVWARQAWRDYIRARDAARKNPHIVDHIKAMTEEFNENLKRRAAMHKNDVRRAEIDRRQKALATAIHRAELELRGVKE